MSNDDEDGDAISGAEKRQPHVVGESPTFDPSASVEAAVHALKSLGTPHALIGGLALGAWGMVRATKDADFAVPHGTAEAAADRIASETAKKHPLRIGGVAVRDPARNIRIDLIDRRFYLARLFREAIAEAESAKRVTRLKDLQVPLVSLEHLLAMKMVSGEPKDDEDAHRILQLKALDYTRARAIVLEHLGIATANRLDTFARAAGRPEVPPRRLYQNGDEADEDT